MEEPMNIVERLAKLREEMAKKGIDFYIVPTADFHQSEYVGEHFKARQFITGFTGSAGTAMITANKAFLWADGRYFIQAAAEIEGTTVELMKMGEPGVPTLMEYIENELPEGGTLGFDGRVIGTGDGKNYQKIVERKGGKICYEHDLIDLVWEDRPALSTEPVFKLDLEYTGETVESKLSRIREEMKKQGATCHAVTTLDDICWTFNFRGYDVKYFPLVLSYAFITMDRVDLYIDENKFGPELKTELEADGVVFKPYNDIYEDIKHISEDEVILVDPVRLNYALYNNIPENVKTVEAANPEILMKALKNKVEQDNIRKAHLKDSVAHARFMKWIKETIGKETITEISAGEKIDEFRAEMGNFIQPAFAAISSYGPNCAMCHYISTPETNVELKKGNFYLADVGAGFCEGSTDITRTYALGEVPQYMKDHFTLVVMGNLRLANAKFLKGCTGSNLDIIARQPFWDRALNYNHGTGHGVGYLLNIHEGPAAFRWQQRVGEMEPLQEGMVLTNEPGIYIEGSHGVRLENELLVREGVANEYGQFMYLETLTYIPMDLDAVNPDIMTAEDRKLLNDYHREVFERVSPYLNEEEAEWLKKYTREI